VDLVAGGLALGALTVVAAFISTLIAFPLAELLPRGGDAWFSFVGMVLNFGVPGVAGAGLARIGWTRTHRRFRAVPRLERHILWCAPCYAVLAGCLFVLVPGWRSADFWLVGQIFLWPAVACAAAIGTDAVQGVRAWPSPSGGDDRVQ